MRPRTTLLALATGAAAMLSATTAPAYAAPGELDPTFGTAGRVVVDTSPANAGFTAVAVQPDGRIVAAGILQTSPNAGLVVRLNRDGSLDPTFGTRSRGLGPVDHLSSVAIAPDGKIVVAGDVGTNGAVWRLDPDGTPDPTFGTNGVRVVDTNGAESLADVIVQGDGRIVAAGSSELAQYNVMTVLRLTDKGDFDPSFGGGDGRVEICLLYTSPSPRDGLLSRMPSSA